MTALALRYVALTDVGLRRSTNQDSGYASDRLLVIADGMGGAAAGDLASSAALEVLSQLDADLGVDAMTALERAVTRANERLGELIAEDPAVEGMGTTLEAMLFDGDKFAVAHLGDSRAYRWRGGTLTQLSTDHTFVQSLVDEGKLTPDEARHHPHRSLLLRAMLGRDDNEADLSWLQPQLGDRYLLCSDGLTDMVDDDTIARVLASETIDIAATELVRLALEAGGYDNVTVVIGEMVEKAEEPDQHLSSADGRPQIVGAAAEQPRRRTGQASAGPDSASTGRLDIDPEEIRYAPVAPSRMRWARRIVALLVVLGVLGGAGWFTYQWSQDQYYVAAHEGKVTIFRGVQAEIPGLTLSHVDQISQIELDELPTFERQQVTDGIAADNREDALRIVADLQREVIPQPDPEPTPTPSPSATPTDDTADETRAAMSR